MYDAAVNRFSFASHAHTVRALFLVWAFLAAPYHVQDFARTLDVPDRHDTAHVTAAVAYILHSAVALLPPGSPPSTQIAADTVGRSVAAAWHDALSALSMYIHNVLTHPSVWNSIACGPLRACSDLLYWVVLDLFAFEVVSFELRSAAGRARRVHVFVAVRLCILPRSPSTVASTRRILVCSFAWVPCPCLACPCCPLPPALEPPVPV